MNEVILLSNPPAPITHKNFHGIPKIFFPFFNNILLDYYLSYFKYNKIKKVFVNFYEIEKKSSDYFLGKWYPGDFLKDIEINIFRENQITGNIGAIKKLENFLQDENIIIFNTGAVPVLDVETVIKYHNEKNADLTIISNNKELENDISSNNFPSVYFFIIKKKLLSNIPPKKYFDLKNQFIQTFKNAKIYTYYVTDGLLPLISFNDYINLIKYIIKNNPLPHYKISDDYIVDKNKFIAIHKSSYIKTKSIKNSIIGKDSFIENNTIINSSIIDDNVKIENDCYIEKSFIPAGEIIKKSTIIIKNQRIKDIKSILNKEYFKDKIWEKILDYSLLLFSLPISIPLIFLISFIILVTEGPPIFFIQERVGKNGKKFKMIKFRTMKKNAENIKTKLKDKNEIDGPMFKMSNDPRITKIGKFLRKTSLDELPQLFNILKGEMSFVGPRPLSEEEMSLHPQWRDIRIKVKPGLTGLWQVKKSKNETFSDWIIYDTSYIINKNPFLYLKIIFLTFFSVLKRKNK